MSDLTPVAKTFSHPKKDYIKSINSVWNTNWVKNNGPNVKLLETTLIKYLGVDNSHYATNANIALQITIKPSDLKGELITTPFSFLATRSTIVWENCFTIFAYIERNSLNIDVQKIEALIMDKTSAISAIHVYGNPCDVIAIETLAKKHNLKVIYDGAHAFGIDYQGKSIISSGDITICSMHATKLYHSVESGFILSKNKSNYTKQNYVKSFGFYNLDTFIELGKNGKNSEFNLATGITDFNYLKDINNRRKELTENYNELPENSNVTKPIWNYDASLNYDYYPVIFDSEELLLKSQASLKINNIISRKYFYPSLADSLPYVTSSKCEVVNYISKRVLCLPLCFDITIKDVTKNCTILKMIN